MTAIGLCLWLATCAQRARSPDRRTEVPPKVACAPISSNVCRVRHVHIREVVLSISLGRGQRLAPRSGSPYSRLGNRNQCHQSPLFPSSAGGKRVGARVLALHFTPICCPAAPTPTRPVILCGTCYSRTRKIQSAVWQYISEPEQQEIITIIEEAGKGASEEDGARKTH